MLEGAVCRLVSACEAETSGTVTTHFISIRGSARAFSVPSPPIRLILAASERSFIASVQEPYKTPCSTRPRLMSVLVPDAAQWDASLANAWAKQVSGTRTFHRAAMALAGIDGSSVLEWNAAIRNMPHGSKEVIAHALAATRLFVMVGAALQEPTSDAKKQMLRGLVARSFEAAAAADRITALRILGEVVCAVWPGAIHLDPFRLVRNSPLPKDVADRSHCVRGSLRRMLLCVGGATDAAVEEDASAKDFVESVYDDDQQFEQAGFADGGATDTAVEEEVPAKNSDESVSGDDQQSERVAFAGGVVTAVEEDISVNAEGEDAEGEDGDQQLPEKVPVTRKLWPEVCGHSQVSQVVFEWCCLPIYSIGLIIFDTKLSETLARIWSWSGRELTSVHLAAN